MTKTELLKEIDKILKEVLPKDGNKEKSSLLVYTMLSKLETDIIMNLECKENQS